jgi:tRNA A37 threonylcarbamoyladenosine dehydratase
VTGLLYEELFERNYGVYSPAEQERIHRARVVIIGCGGIGGVVAIILARTGIGHFVLYEYDTYTPTNMNRQIACFSDTMGVNKAAAVRDMILKINPEAEVCLHQEALKPEEICAVLQQGDVILPASDEWPLSIAILGAAKEQGVPAIMAYPVGALARVSTFLPDSP